MIHEGQSCRNLKWDFTWQIIVFTKDDLLSDFIYLGFVLEKYRCLSSVFNALSIGCDLVAAVLLCMEQGDIRSRLLVILSFG